MVIEFVDDDSPNDWDTVESMFEEWIDANLRRLTHEQKQSLIPLRDFIFDRTTEGRTSPNAATDH